MEPEIPTIRFSLLKPMVPSRRPPLLITRRMLRLIRFVYKFRDEFNASMEGNFTVTLENANEAPFNLHNTGPLTMAENAPINTVVGNFNASDPDTGTVLTYSLVNGAGDGDNSLFSMEANMGRLRTAAMFDYENDASSYSIRVAVSDSYGLSTEQSFTVDLTDVIENLAPLC